MACALSLNPGTIAPSTEVEADLTQALNRRARIGHRASPSALVRCSISLSLGLPAASHALYCALRSEFLASVLQNAEQYR
jgi:hypothetical protein